MQIFSRTRLSIIFTLFAGLYLFVSAQSNPPATTITPAEISRAEGWSCEDFPCEDDIDGFLQRIQVPNGFEVSHIGQFPGQPKQITYGLDGKLYASLLEYGKQQGAVYAMDSEGNTERISPRIWSPVGLAFSPENDLYISGRAQPQAKGAVWKLLDDGTLETIVDELPCCYSIDSQPNGMIFGEDGRLYLGVGSTTDHGESKDPAHEQFSTPEPLEASIIQINVNTGNARPYAEGIRNPYDLTLTSDGEIYATDNGLVTGQGDRILQIVDGGFYGFPYWRARACESCPPREGKEALDDWLLLESYTLPRGIVAYQGTQFPANMVDTLFVAFWNGTDFSQRIVWIDPDDPQLGSEDYAPHPFVTGLIRPVDVTIAPDGSLVIADFIYGHIWRVSYTGRAGSLIQSTPQTEEVTELPPAIATVISNANNNSEATPQPPPPSPTAGASGIVFATATPSG